MTDHPIRLGPVTPEPAPADSVPTETNAVLQKCGWTLVWLGILTSGLGMWSAWSSWPGAAAIAPLLVFGGFVGMAAVWLVTSPVSRVMQWIGLATALLAVGAPQAVGIHVRQYYTTDSAAFNQVAARILLQGRNPYASSMASASNLLNPPSHFWTYTVDGGHVTQVSYPAASFLLQIPAMALGFHHEIADWTDLGAWLVTGVLLFVLVPASLRWLSVLVLLASVFVGMFSNGGTDALYLPFLVVAVWRWDRFGTGRAAGIAGWIGPLSLGLACAIKQSPWFCVPFLVVGLGLEARCLGQSPWRIPARYLAIVAAVFAVCNLPFIIWGPRAWAHGTLLPFTEPLVADGQGVVTLALHGLTGGVVLTLLSVAGALAYVALMAAFVLWYPRMKVVWLLLLPAVLFVPGRSLASYLVDFFPAALVAALTVAVPAHVTPETGGTRRRWPARVAVVVPAAAAAAAAVVAFTSAPLQLSVDGFRTSHATQRLLAVTVTVHNLTGHAVTPHFMVAIGSDHPYGFWSPSSGNGPMVLGPRAMATVTLHPTTYTWAPSHGGYWLVEAYTSSPNALSTSPLQFWTLGRAQ